MNEQIKWRFPRGNYSKKRGISSSEFETFKKDPFKSLAREILQNSIDAIDSDEEPVRVEFNEFEIKREDVPGIDDFEKELENCLSSWVGDSNCEMVYQNMLEEIRKDRIRCLRISDFNTTGLKGIERSDDENTPFSALTKGTGISRKKPGINGGSKGVGKYAAYGTSRFSLIFYSTKTVDGHKGSIGVAELVSSKIQDNSDFKDWTQGVGFYSINDYNEPNIQMLDLDPSFKRTECGTDIFIIGFKSAENWEKDVINRLLDSFLVSIYREKLEIKINDVEINKSNLKDVVFSDLVATKEKANIISQYRLISNENNDVKRFDIETDYGTLDLYVLPLSKSEEELATHKCVMVRYPFMKIKTLPLSSNIRVSALCIIKNDKLGKILLSIENPQHIDWEYKRIEDPSQIKEIKNTMDDVHQQIQDYVIQCIQSGEVKELDPSGAGDYIPGVDSGENEGLNDENTKGQDKCVVKPSKVNRTTSKKPIREEPDSAGLEPEIGNEGADGDDVEHPTGKNKGHGESRQGGEGQSEKKPGENIVLAIRELTGIKYRVILMDKNAGKYRVVFDYIENLNNCKLSFFILDDVGHREKVLIEGIKCNGCEISSNDNFLFGPFVVNKGKNILEVDTNTRGIFSCEVKIYANS